MPKYCHECGAPLRSAAKFCAECGTSSATSVDEKLTAGITNSSQVTPDGAERGQVRDQQWVGNAMPIWAQKKVAAENAARAKAAWDAAHTTTSTAKSTIENNEAGQPPTVDSSSGGRETLIGGTMGEPSDDTPFVPMSDDAFSAASRAEKLAEIKRLLADEEQRPDRSEVYVHGFRGQIERMETSDWEGPVHANVRGMAVKDQVAAGFCVGIPLIAVLLVVLAVVFFGFRACTSVMGDGGRDGLITPSECEEQGGRQTLTGGVDTNGDAIWICTK